MFSVNLRISIIIVLLLVLIDVNYRDYICTDLFKKLSSLFGIPINTKIENSDGYLWNLLNKKIKNYEDIHFKNILYFPKDNYKLILNENIKLFSGFNNIQLTKKAIYMKLLQINNLSKTQINYNMFSEVATIKSNTLENIFSLGILIKKIASSELSLSEIQNNNLILNYEKILENYP